MSIFSLAVQNMTPARALAAADELERAIGEIASGTRKPGRIPVEAIAVLVQYVRNTADARGAT